MTNKSDTQKRVFLRTYGWRLVTLSGNDAEDSKSMLPLAGALVK